MIGVGIDVSKLKSTICMMNEYGEVLHKPYEITHTETDNFCSLPIAVGQMREEMN